MCTVVIVSDRVFVSTGLASLTVHLEHVAASYGHRAMKFGWDLA